MLGVDYFPVLQASVASLLTTYLPEFQRFGVNIFLAAATLRLAFFGYALMLGGIGDPRLPFLATMLRITLAGLFINYYSTPDPVFGTSFSHLITDQMIRFTTVLNVNAVTLAFTTLSDIMGRFIPPTGLFVFSPYIVYSLVLVVILAAQVVTLIIVAFGFIAQAVLVLVGPLFVCLFLVPHLDRLFYSWLNALIQYSFLPVIGYAYILVGLTLMSQILAGLPSAITVDLYPTYGVIVIVLVLTYVVGFLFIPSLNAAIFSGGGAHSVAGMAIGAAVGGARAVTARVTTAVPAAAPQAAA